MNHYVADFETTSFKQYLKDGRTRVFMWAIADIEKNKVVQQGTNIESFMDYVTLTRRDKSTNIYFHNLRFDGAFIVNHLLTNGYKNVKAFSKNPNQEFKSLINDMGVWYGITLRIAKAGYKITVNFFDSYKKIPLPVKAIAKAYNLSMSKGDFDYEMYRPMGYKPTPEEWDYVYRDVLIVAQALKEKIDSGLDRMTLSSDAYTDFQSDYTPRYFEYFFPNLTLEEWEYLRKAYRGGWVYANERHKGKVLENVLSFDVNSLYPASMYKTLLPVGKPRYFIGKYKPHKTFPLYVQKIVASFKLKDGYLPTIQTSSLGRMNRDLFLTDTEDDEVELSFTNLDLEIFLRHHHVYSIKYIDGYMFKGSDMQFTTYIDKWAKVKENETGGKRQMAKDMLNSLYGKFGTSPKRRDKKPRLEKGVLKFENGEVETSRYLKYIPVAIFTTAYARVTEIGASQKLYDYHVYSDTDSIKVHNITLEEVAKVLDIDSKKIGKWKYEARYEKFKMLKAKHYSYIMGDEFITKEEDRGLKITASGITDDVKKTITSFDDFKVGFTTDKKLLQRQVVGGVVLVPTKHEIK